MSNIIEVEAGNFSMTPNFLLNNSSISLTAKGLYAFMRSKPPAWNFTIRSMAKQLKEGETAIRNALSELRGSGWVVYVKRSNGTGVYQLLWDGPKTEEPSVDNQVMAEPKPENPNVGNPMKGKPTRISKKEPIVKKIDKELKEPVCVFTESFETFWKLYPKKVNKKKALGLWLKLKPDQSLINTIMQSLGKHCVSAGWAKDGGQFVPHASTWLNAERWNDEVASTGNKPAFMANHTGFDDKDYTAGMTEQEDGSYVF